MNRLRYFNKTVIITMVLVSLVGCGEKVKQVDTSSSKENSATIEDESSPTVSNNDEIKPVETTSKDLKETKLDAETKKKLDTFFSNFSEAHVTTFEKDKIDDSSLISFGIRHVIINDFKLIQYKGENKNEGYIKSEDVDLKSWYYFGKNVDQHKTVDEYIFENGFYKIKMASGEAYTFSQIDKLYDLRNNKYKAEVSVYKASSGFTGDSHGNRDDWKASGEEIPKLSNKVIATIQKINEDGNERYILVDYKLN